MTAATVTDSRVASGTATPTGMTSASKGTATRASPNPNADRTRVATNTTASTASSSASAAIAPPRPAREVEHMIYYGVGDAITGVVGFDYEGCWLHSDDG